LLVEEMAHGEKLLSKFIIFIFSVAIITGFWFSEKNILDY
jgi:uncharacterized membrane protein